MSDVLLQEKHGRVLRLTLNRPSALNALNNELTQALVDALAAADRDQSVGAVLLCAAGRAFCAGADIKELAATTSGGPRLGAIRADLTASLHLAFTKVSVPIVSAVNGVAVGGGCGVAVAADLVVAAESARFGYPEIKRGAVAAIVMAMLVRLVGRKAAYEMIALGEVVDAHQARMLGLVSRVVPDEKLQEAAMAMATTLAGFDHDASRATKRLFQRTADLPFPQAIEASRDANLIMRGYSIRTTV